VRKTMTALRGELDALVAEEVWADTPLVSLVEGITRLKELEPKCVADLSFRREISTGAVVGS
jgi:hypothetical protein